MNEVNTMKVINNKSSFKVRLKLSLINNHHVYNYKTEIYFNLSEIHGEIKRKSKDFKIITQCFGVGDPQIVITT